MEYQVDVASCRNEDSTYFCEALDFLSKAFKSNVDVSLYNPLSDAKVLFMLVDKKCDIIDDKLRAYEHAKENNIPIYILYKTKTQKRKWQIYRHAINGTMTARMSVFGHKVTNIVVHDINVASQKVQVQAPPRVVSAPVYIEDMENIVI